MRVVIAGAGLLAKHFIDELPRVGIEVVLLTRSHKSDLDGKPLLIEQRITDYSSVDKLTEQISDCDALVSTVSDMTQAFVDVHLALIEACKRSPKCKRFIPSEFGGNSEDFPEQADSTYQCNIPVKAALKAQSELEWSVISIGWLSDFLVPAANRYHHDIGELFALDLATKSLKIPGTGHEKFAFTSARDVARAVAAMLKSPNKWRHFTYVQGEQTTWLEMAEPLRDEGGIPDLKVSFESVEELYATLQRKESLMSMVVTEFKLGVPLGMMNFDQTKVQRDHDDFSPTMHLRSPKELFEEIKANPSVVV